MAREKVKRPLSHKIFLFIGGLAVAIFLLASMVVTATVEIISVLLGGEEEEYQKEQVVSEVTLMVSEKVESYREKILAQAKKCGSEEYIDLFLAVVMQESGGNGQDIFQCSESLGKPPNSLTLDESIEQGVKYLTATLKRAKVSSPEDIVHIRLALQGYNFGGAYIDYALEKDGGWTQENVFSYAEEKSGGVKNEGSRVEQLGPWRYGDQYYSDHVLRYYNVGSGSAGEGEAAKVALEERMEWLFPDGTPTSAQQMQKYLVQIDVPIINKKGKKDSMTLTVHKKLAAEIKAAFADMAEAGFPIKPEATAGYNWRMMASNNSKVSHHSYGCVVDVNWTSNGAPYTGWDYKPGKDPYSVTPDIVNIWKKHGFYWGGDWKGYYNDPMHFTYTNH